MSSGDTEDAIRRILTGTHVWAVIGCSPDPGRASNRVARVLQSHGFRLIPVNPACDELLGERCYPTVTDIPASRARAAGLDFVMDRCPAIELPRLAAA